MIIGLIKKLSVHLRREALLRIYKSFVRPNLDYGDIILDKPNNESFKSRIESIQYKSMCSNNWSHSRNILGENLQGVRFRIFKRQMLVSKTYVFL